MFSTLTVVLKICKIYDIDGKAELPNSNVIAILIPILENYLGRVRRVDSIGAILKTLCFIAKCAK